MPKPHYADADLWRLLYVSRTLDLDVSAVEPGDCICRLGAMLDAARQGRVQYGQVWPEGDPGECRDFRSFADGAVVLNCSNADRVTDALADEGYGGKALDLELLARLDRAAEREALRLTIAAGGPQGRAIEVALSLLERGAA